MKGGNSINFNTQTTQRRKRKRGRAKKKEEKRHKKYVLIVLFSFIAQKFKKRKTWKREYALRLRINICPYLV